MDNWLNDGLSVDQRVQHHGQAGCRGGQATNLNVALTLPAVRLSIRPGGMNHGTEARLPGGSGANSR